MKLVDTYYVEITNPRGGVYGPDQTLVSVNSRYAFDVYSDRSVRAMEIFQQRYNQVMVAEILKAPRSSSGSFADYTWVKS